MEIKTETIEYRCDCCNKPMQKNLFVRNDGSYQADFHDKNGFQICLVCGGRLFMEFMDKLDLKPEDIKHRYLDLKEKINIERAEGFKKMFPEGFGFSFNKNSEEKLEDYMANKIIDREFGE